MLTMRATRPAPSDAWRVSVSVRSGELDQDPFAAPLDGPARRSVCDQQVVAMTWIRPQAVR